MCFVSNDEIKMFNQHTRGCIDGLVQERRNSSAMAMELRLSCINPLVSSKHVSQATQQEKSTIS